MNSRLSRFPAIAACLSLLLFACAIEEELRINADGSGTYGVKLTVPKEMGSDFGDLRKSAAEEGFTVVEERETEQERVLVLRKDFTDISSLNDGNSRFELATSTAGWLEREYRFRARLQAVGYGAFKRQITISMPGRIKASSQGEIDGSRVRWDASRGGSIEITARGYSIPLSNRTLLLIALITAALAFLVVRRNRAARVQAFCAICRTPRAHAARFCAACGAEASIAQS